MDFDSLSRLVQMAIGIGLVIFVHELGHFIAARMCKVRVETFSLGFGPKLCGVRRGDTLYQVALLPLGGYVRMAGEDSVEPNSRPLGDELHTKSVGVRFFIYSGGVLMNMVFAAIVLPLVMFHGVKFNEPVVGSVAPGSPAWRAGIEPGTRILEVNGVKIASFEYIAQEIALAPPGESHLLVQGPRESAPRRISLEPAFDERLGLATIGIAPSADRTGAILVTGAALAERAGLSESDRIVAVRGVPEGFTLEEALEIAARDGAPLRLLVAGEDGSERELALEPEWTTSETKRVLGLLPALSIVREVRAGSAAAKLGLAAGDRIVRANGRRVLQRNDLALAVLPLGPLVLEVERAGERITLRGEALDRAGAFEFARDVALAPNLAQCEVVVAPRAAAEGALRSGDRLLSANGVELRDWEGDFLPLVQAVAAEQRSLTLKVLREHDGLAQETLEVQVTPGPQSAPDYGFGQREALYTYRAESLSEAIVVGVQATLKFATDSWLMLKRMVLGQVSSKHMGGIISIGVYAYSWAELGLAKLFFFLCMLSVNLAFINVLPVPLLDGGHLLFLVIEKLKGSPVSERVHSYSQVVGMVLILTLLVYVTYNDVMRVASL
ncbi:MAG: RIP metalloprotease RseP [Planctomycetes bacterium]|nr:RIP metalloprotease RseP [Planctomycetota bacterium]